MLTLNEKIFLVDAASNRCDQEKFNERWGQGIRTDQVAENFGLVEFVVDVDGYYPTSSDKLAEWKEQLRQMGIDPDKTLLEVLS